jgi:NAD-dependent deacetylase
MKVIAITGAGISKSAGIPTFEEVPHLKEKLSVSYKEKYPNDFKRAINLLKNNVKDKKPTKAHLALAKYNIPIITMNVDGLHTKAGSKNVIEIHGNAEKDNIVLYGQNILRSQDCLELLKSTKEQAIKDNEKVTLLVIGTSMQTQFPNGIVEIAEYMKIDVKTINKNADEEVPKFLDEVFAKTAE